MNTEHWIPRNAVWIRRSLSEFHEIDYALNWFDYWIGSLVPAKESGVHCELLVKSWLLWPQWSANNFEAQVSSSRSINMTCQHKDTTRRQWMKCQELQVEVQQVQRTATGAGLVPYAVPAPRSPSAHDWNSSWSPQSPHSPGERRRKQKKT